MPLSAAFFNYIDPAADRRARRRVPAANAFSYWVFLFGGDLHQRRRCFFKAAPDAGWFGYAPLTDDARTRPGCNIDFWVLGLQILGIASLAAGFNFIVTIINMRAPGMTLMRMPMFTWMTLVIAVPDRPGLPGDHDRGR